MKLVCRSAFVGHRAFRTSLRPVATVSPYLQWHSASFHQSRRLLEPPSGEQVGDFHFTPGSKVEQASSSVPHTKLFSLRGSTTVITGAGRGLGITLAAAVLEAGGNVVCMDILREPSKNEWAELQKTAKDTDLHLSYRNCDITNEADMEAAMEDAARIGREKDAPLRGIVGCAGIQQKIPALEYPGPDFERMLRINTVGAFFTAKFGAKVMRKEGTPGSIVMIASMSGTIANRGLFCTAYNTSKAAVHQMCRSLAQEWGPDGIRINSLSPGYIRTLMTDELLDADPELRKLWMAGALLNRLGVPDDFKAPCVFLLAPGSSFMTGSDLRVDGGHTATA